MSHFENKVAFITGAASGIGLALTKGLAAKGAKVMMADINGETLENSASGVKASGGDVATCICDVADAASVKAGADATIKAFGKVHIVVNNAGVGLAGKTGAIELEDWRWITDINLLGVVYGTEVFTPLIKSHGEGGHVVNTASMAGHATMPYMAPYHATKFAVVGYSESLRPELAKSDIGVHVLCPTWVKSNIYNTALARPSAEEMDVTPDADQMYQMTKDLVDNGMTAERYAALVMASMEQNRFYVFNDAEARPAIDMRRDAILADYDACLEDLKSL